MKRLILGVTFVVAAATVSLGAEQPPSGAPTFSKDVAPIFYKNCVVCHRPGEVAPMSLIAYDDARPWARAIKAKVSAREMPPWLADPRFGKFKNDRSLSQKDIDTVVAWVDAGAQRGNDKDLPPVPDNADGWSFGEPDAILDAPVERELPAEGEIENRTLYGLLPFQEDTFVQAVQSRPNNTAVVHHATIGVRALPPGTKVVDGVPQADGKKLSETDISRRAGESRIAGPSKLVSYVPGRGSERYPEGTGRLLRKGEYATFSMHYQASGKPERERTRLGFWVAKSKVTHEVINGSMQEAYVVEGREIVGQGNEVVDSEEHVPNIPPYADNWKIVSFKTFPEPVTLYGMSPHMHLRGKDMSYTITYPDGREETVLSVPKFDFNWQLYYELETPLRLPAGSKLTAVAHYDNSLKNVYNPAPEKEVFWSEQSWDEMFGPQVRITVDSRDLSKAPARTQQQQQ